MDTRYFHRTCVADAILREGFRDGHGSYGLATLTLTGVFISDEPLDVNEGAHGDDLLEITFPSTVVLDDFEIVEELSGYREWCVPAALLNQQGTIRLIPEDD